MILNGCTISTECAFTNTRACKPVPTSLISACIPRLPARAALLSIRNSWVPHLESKSWLSRGVCKYSCQVLRSLSPFFFQGKCITILGDILI